MEELLWAYDRWCFCESCFWVDGVCCLTWESRIWSLIYLFSSQTLPDNCSVDLEFNTAYCYIKDALNRFVATRNWCPLAILELGAVGKSLKRRSRRLSASSIRRGVGTCPLLWIQPRRLRSSWTFKANLWEPSCFWLSLGFVRGHQIRRSGDFSRSEHHNGIMV